MADLSVRLLVIGVVCALLGISLGRAGIRGWPAGLLGATTALAITLLWSRFVPL